MTVSPSVLLVSIAIGVPLMLLALGVLYHAYLLGRQPLDLGAHVEQLATGDPAEVMRGLQRSMNDVRGELTRQRASLREMLSEAQPATATAAAAAPAAAAPIAAATPPQATAPLVMPAPMLPIDRTAGELRGAVHELAAEGLSDRSIARRLRIGLEEVRLARASGGGPRRPA